MNLIKTICVSFFTKVVTIVGIMKQLKEICEHERWRSKIVNSSAASVEDYFSHFEYILIVDPKKILDVTNTYPAVVFSEYEYPNRTRSNAALIRIFRVTPKNETDGKHYFDEIWGKDTAFVATNNEQDAVMIALRFS